MAKKKVLIFIDWYLPGYKAGGPIQSVANLVEHLKDEFEFSIITRDTDYCETTPYSNIKSDVWNTLPNGVKVYYFSENELTHKNIRNLIRKTDYDCTYLNGIYSLYFTLIPLFYLRKKHHKTIVIAARGMFSEGSLSVKANKKKFFIRAVKVLQFFDKVIFHTASEIEKHEIRKVLGNMVMIKTAGVLPQKSAIPVLVNREKKSGYARIVNIARVSPEKNTLYALQILKHCKQNIQFDFYGPVYDKEYFLLCQQAMAELPANVVANYKGSVESNHVINVLSDYEFMFMPTTGENFGHIILQSFSVGCPVVISDKTHWKHLQEKKIGWEIPLNEITEFSKTIDTAAVMKQDEYNLMSRHAYDYAQHYINNPDLIEQNRHLFV